MDSSRIRGSPRCHGMIEFDDHPGVEKLALGHKRLQGVPLHKLHRLSKLRIFRKIRNIIIGLAVQILGTAI